MAKQDDGLFLLEVLIDKVLFVKSPCFSDKDFRTCVTIEAQSVEPLEICDDDPGACSAKSGGPFVKTFNSGKSCLFSLQEADIQKAMSNFPIKVTVYKSLPCGCLPTKIIMGEATIDMTKEFVQSRKKFLEDPTNVSYEALKDSFRIVGPDSGETGEIVMFLRISCFGKLIITRFQGTSGPPNLRAGQGPSIIDRSCNPRREFQTFRDPCVCGAAHAAATSGASGSIAPCKTLGGSAGGYGICPLARDPYSIKPCEDPDDPCFCSGPKPPPKQPMVCRNTDPYCLHVPKGLRPQGTQFTCTTEGCIQTARHGQQAVYARGDSKNDAPNKDVFVLKIAKTAVQGDKKSKIELELVTPKGPDKKPPVRKVNMRIATEPDYCCPPGNKVIFQMPSDTCGMNHKQRAHFHFTSDGVGDVARDDPAQLMPTTAEEYTGVVYDFPNQVIKMRIGKVIEMPGRKSKLEYQFITPTGTPEKVVPVIDTRTAQCVATCPDCCPSKSSKRSSIPCSETTTVVDEYPQSFPEKLKFSTESMQTKLDNSTASLCTIRSKRRSVSFSDKIDYVSKSYSHFSNFRKKYNRDASKSIFGKKETTVYMTLFNDFCRRRTSGTQATASVNKCLQAKRSNASSYNPYCTSNPSNNTSNCQSLTTPNQDSRRQSYQNNCERYSDVYYFGKKKEGMGSRRRTSSVSAQNDGIKLSTASVQAQSHSSASGAQTKKTSGASTNGRMVSIKENPCPGAIPNAKGEMVATVSHIRIGPKDPCPVHGREPCQGPRCIAAAAALSEEQEPVKISTATNPRRGVFELVIRRMNGAPLARNELMLEWTPPPTRPSTCGSPCATPCIALSPVCRPSKCKMVVCRPSPCRPARCCKKPCKKPCGEPCRPPPCKRCGKCGKSSCCGKTCRPCKPCRPCVPASLYRPCPRPKCKPCSPPRCKPCPPSTCRPCPPSPCKPCPPSPCRSPCTSPCKSSPCLRPCPVGYKRPRKIRSQPKIKAHRKIISPCYNRAKNCPVVRCRSVPEPCVGCCRVAPCPPRKCYSVAPCRPRKCYPTYLCSPRESTLDEPSTSGAQAEHK
ncbi:uncharacterized protein LOC124645150 [Helicoverpa zea]|uniref:uncharacterized protein LOC124645150 n=1 Tax=Helicoverpa zea TaxID=7113 RepID=UPI001F595D8D|nr:uncharacterized protein LOC124645150 [Helicoverpa zea]